MSNNEELPLWLWYTTVALGVFTVLCFFIMFFGMIIE